MTLDLRELFTAVYLKYARTNVVVSLQHRRNILFKPTTKSKAIASRNNLNGENERRRFNVKLIFLAGILDCC